MNKKNYLRKNCKDVFKSFLVENATYNGYFEFPRIYPCEEIPNKLIPFSKSISCTNHNQWIHFYEDDYLIERIWNNPTIFIAQYNYQKLQSEMENIASPKWRKLQRIF